MFTQTRWILTLIITTTLFSFSTFAETEAQGEILESLKIEAFRAPFVSAVFLDKENVKLPLTWTVEYYADDMPEDDENHVVISLTKIGTEYWVTAEYFRNGELIRAERTRRMKRYTSGLIKLDYTYKFYAHPYGWLNEKLVIRGMRSGY